ncbi:CBN-DIE-1 protein [Caenorhabditis brenneri]|uniref:CBN-DIE-1 protein n=1 Tax=Caenorhabditis brenneri TaxID=135651 RepID=G0NAK1_CAEBE|nr:CBN-DIE-1 protein [Caenorhabditis brenneri]
MMANAVEMQQLLMSMDPSSANQFNVMNKGGACVMAASGGSASPTSSSGAPSSSSILADSDDKEQFIQSQLLQSGIGGNQWMSMLLQQQQQQQQKGGDLSDMVPNASSLIDMLANGNTDMVKQLAAQFAQNKTNENDADDARESSPSPPPAVSLNSTLAAMVLPTTSTSTGCSAASTTSSVDSAASSVIVNGHLAPQTSAVDDDEPATKKVKVAEEDTPATPTSTGAQAQLMQFIQQMGLGTLQQQNQKQMKESQDMMGLGQFFPQAMGLPFFPSALHQQFPGMQDFDPISALSTPNKGSGVKRQYSSNGKNYCDICNKEVCNKYFLRTHMLKMHGIVIDENKTVIANIDTSIKERDGELTFRCDTCRTMFQTRNQLRQHRQDVHGVLPLSTPRNNTNKSSVPSTPNGNNNSGPNSASLGDEKCQLCDKRFSAAMMTLHVMQEHMGQANNQNELSQMLSMFNQAARTQAKSEEKDMSTPLLDCSECSYKTRDAKNLELHLERHYKMSEAKSRGDEEEDVALKLTTEAALQMVVQNQNQFDGDSSAAALNLTFKNDGVKKEIDEEKVAGNQNHERNSHTSGSISPSGSIGDLYPTKLNECPFPKQTFLIRCNDGSGEFLTEFLANIPVRSVIDGPRKIVFDLHPAPTAN